MSDIFSPSNTEFLETISSRLNLTQRTAVLLSMNKHELLELIAATKSYGGVVESIIIYTILNNKILSELAFSRR